MKMINKLKSIQNLHFKLKAVLFCLYIVFFQQHSFGQNGEYVLDGVGGVPATLGSTPSNFFASPFLSNRKNSRVQYLYEPSEEGLTLAKASGFREITSIAFNVVSLSNMVTLPSYQMKNMKISMGHTDATYDGVGGTNVWGITMPPEGECTWTGSSTAEYLQEVKGSFNLTISSPGWIVLDLENPFMWDGVNSIVIEICKSDPGTSFNSAFYRFEGIQHTNPSTTTHPYTLTRSFYSNTNPGAQTPGCQMISGSANTTTELTSANRKFRPNIRFTFACNPGSLFAGNAKKINPINSCSFAPVQLEVQNETKSSGLTYQWQRSDDNIVFSDIPGENQKTIGVERQATDVWYRRATICGGSGVFSSSENVDAINTWNGTAWSLGAPPTSDKAIRINGDFDTTIHGSSIMSACVLNVQSGTLTVKSGDIVSLKEKLIVHEDATVIFENNASLIQENDAVVNEGKIVYKRDSQPVRLLDYTYWSSPVSGMTPSQFSAGTPTNRIYHWNHLTTGLNPQSWVGGVANLPMVAGKGYIIRAPNGYPSTGAGTVFTGAFEGVPNNGIVVVPAQGDLEKWNLIGNPYPAAIDIEKFLITNSSILEGTIRLWTHNTLPSAIPSYPGFSPQELNYSSDDYATYNLSGSIGFPADNSGVNNATPGRFVGAGQSFMVAGRGAPSGDVIFNNEMRKKESGYDNSQFFRNGTSNQAEIEKNRLWLEVIHQNGKFNQTMVGYIEGATNDLDWGYDSKFRHTGDVKIYSFVGNDKLAIQGKALPFNSNDTIPLGFTTILSGEFLLNLYQFDNFFENQEVYLLDKYTNTFHNIKEGLYAFTSISGTFDDRFELRFTKETLSINPIMNTKNSILSYSNDSKIVVKSKDIQIQSIIVFDSAGRVLFDKNKMDVSEVIITEVAKNNQLLLVQVTTEDGLKSTQKIIH